jgi:hypothetical protein
LVGATTSPKRSREAAREHHVSLSGTTRSRARITTSVDMAIVWS